MIVKSLKIDDYKQLLCDNDRVNNSEIVITNIDILTHDQVNDTTLILSLLPHL